MKIRQFNMEEKYMNKKIQPTNENLSAAVDFTVTMLNFFKEVSNSKVKEVELSNQYNLDYYTEKKKYKLQKKEIKEKTKIEMKKIELKEKQIETMQNIINVAYKAYNKKIDFYQSQLQSCEEFYNQQIIFFKQRKQLAKTFIKCRHGARIPLHIVSMPINHIKIYEIDEAQTIEVTFGNFQRLVHSVFIVDSGMTLREPSTRKNIKNFTYRNNVKTFFL